MASSSKESAAKVNLVGKRNSEDDLENKPILKRHKETSEEKETTEGLADPSSLLQKSDQANLIPVKETVDGLDDTPEDFVEGAALMKNTLFIAGLSRHAKIQDIIDFFKDVGQVVDVRLAVKPYDGRRAGYGYLEFASPGETKKALEKKNGECLLNRKIILDVSNKIASSLGPPPKYSLDHKVWNEDCLRRQSRLVEGDETPPDFAEEVLFVANLSPQTKISDIKDFCNNDGVVVSVRLIVNQEGKHVGYGFVEFLSANEAKKVLEKKNGEYLHDQKILLMKGHGKTPVSADAVSVRTTKTLFVAHLTPQTIISDIINFFQDVGQVVHVRLIANNKGKHVGWGFVEFASANDAEKALEKKNGEYLQDGKIFLEAAKMDPFPPPKYCIDHKVWFEDHLRQESLLIEEDGAMEGLAETPDIVEEVRKKTLFVTNLPPETKIITIIEFFKDVGEIVGVRLIVDDRGKQVGCGFVEFASANEAEKALEQKNGKNLRYRDFLFRKIFLDVAERASYPIRPKYCIDHKVWFEDHLRQESLLIEEDGAMEGLAETPDIVEEVRKKTLFVTNLPPETKIITIIEFFKDVGEIVGVRLIVDDRGKQVGCGFVEFASANEAEKALEQKNGKNLRYRDFLFRKIFLDVAERASYPIRPKYNLAEKLWYEDNLLREPNLKQQKEKSDGFCGKKTTFSPDED
ncbi:PREDICTED: nucleolin [Camelina sativa]|uniref:Nucleolin n=1 Tax=Camelina sativa TaxID=90675 RepID=A0ABM0V4E6_CAMSA|nr:PREDICTED: nucleolin [Camelina sativa]